MSTPPNKFAVDWIDKEMGIIEIDDGKHKALFTPNTGDRTSIAPHKGVGTFLGVVEESADDAGQYMGLGTLQAAVASLTNCGPARISFITRDHGDGQRTRWAYKA